MPEAPNWCNYWEHAVDPDGKLRDRTKERDQYLEDIAEEIRYVKASGARIILDVGAGLGWFLSSLPSNWIKYGVEPSQWACQHAHQTYGLTLHCGTLESAAFKTGLCDLVFCHHVIEHVSNPISLIVEIGRVLHRGGMLVLGTPDFESPCAKRFGDKYRMLCDKTHVSLFGYYGCRRMLEDFGFAVDDVQFPFPERYATETTMLRWRDTAEISPPWPGNWMTFYCRKLT